MFERFNILPWSVAIDLAKKKLFETTQGLERREKALGCKETRNI